MSDYPVEVLRTQVYDGYMADVLNLPGEFKSWLTDYMAVNIPFIPVSQLQGYKGTLAKNSIINTEIDVTGLDGAERAWHDFGGPSVTGLADGTYFAAWGCKTGRAGGGSSHTRIGPSVNGADPATYAEFTTSDPDAMVWRPTVLTVAGGNDNNTVTLEYWYDLGGGAIAQFLHRWLTVVRIT